MSFLGHQESITEGIFRTVCTIPFPGPVFGSARALPLLPLSGRVTVIFKTGDDFGEIIHHFLSEFIYICENSQFILQVHHR